MPIDVDTSDAPRFLRFTLIGTWPSLEEQRDLRLRLVHAQQLTADTRALIDLRAVENTPSYHEANAIVAAAARDGGLPRIRAYLVGSAIQYGVARQFKAIAGVAAHIEIFTIEQDAMMWLWSTDAHS